MNTKVNILSWNLAGEISVDGCIAAISEAFTSNPLVIGIAFQEIADNPNINDATILSLHDQLRSIISTNIPKDYEIISTDAIGAVFLALVCHINSSVITSDQVSQTFGRDPNKGALGFYFSINSTSFGLYAAHLECDASFNDERVFELKSINSKLSNVEYGIIAGDLNFRIDLPREKVLEKLRKNKLSSLLRHDQLTMSKKWNIDLRGLFEHQISFPPTYKYDLNSTEYDTSAKQRVPSFTDRVLIRRNVDKGVKILSYRALNDRLESDHRPILCEIEFELIPE